LRQLGQDAFAELVPRSRERERSVRVQALQAAAARRAADARVELGAKPPLFGLRRGKATREIVVLLRGTRPALDPAGGLEPGDRCDEVPACDVELRREGTAVLVERGLLGDCRPSERATDGNAHERARPSAELALDDRLVVHALRLDD
jgi:hypothetical protein